MGVPHRAVRIVSLLVLVAGAAPLDAQQREGRFEGGIAWGRSFGGTFARGSNEYYDRTVEADTAVLSGVRLAYNFTDHVSVEFLAERADTLFIDAADGVFASRPGRNALQMRFFEGGPRFTLSRGRFVPFVGLGFGLAVLDPDIPNHPEVRDTNRLSLHADVGFKAYAFPWLGLRLDVRPRAVYLGARRLGEDTGAFDSGRWFRHVDGDAGLFLSF